ncbi:MAG: hypothetical protein JSV42_09910 [Chloroflexota bacterium]|nr:MAG: hypothetical protein JSV42_09910 [Chloroflexota bacterium]
MRKYGFLPVSIMYFAPAKEAMLAWYVSYRQEFISRVYKRVQNKYNKAPNETLILQLRARRNSMNKVADDDRKT